MKRLSWLITSFLLLVGVVRPGMLHAQRQELLFEHLTIADGLPGPGIIDILQDGQGYLWLGTWYSLARYDGYEFTYFNFDASDSTSLTGGFVSALHEDQSGTLWVGTCGGLNRYDRATERFTRYEHDPADRTSLGGSCVYDVYEDQQGYLWVATLDGGLSRLLLDDPQSGFTRFRHDPDDVTTLGSNWVNVIYEDQAGVLWVGTTNGLSRFDRETERFSRFMYDPAMPENPGIDMMDPSTYLANTIYVLLEDRTGSIWAGTHGNGLCRFDQQAETFFCYRHSPDDPRSINDDIVFGLAEDLSGDLWVGTTQGLNRFDPTTETFTGYQHEPEDAPLDGQWILDLYVDRAGVLWIGTWGGLLSRTDLATDVFARYEGFVAESQYEGANGWVWISIDDGIHRLDRSTGTVTPFYLYSSDSRGLRADDVETMYEDRSGTLWVSTKPGVDSPPGIGDLYRFDPKDAGRFTRYTYDPDEERSLGTGWVRAIHEDRAGNLWLGTWGDGLKRFNREQGTFTHFRHDPNDPHSLSDNNLPEGTIYEDRSGVLWVGTANGLNRFDPKTETFTRYQHDPDDPQNLHGYAASTIYEDASGAIWVGAGGLSRLDQTTETFIHYPVNDGVVCLLGDEAGRLWMSTLRSLVRFDPQTETFTHYGEEKGVKTRDFPHGSTCHKSHGGEMYFSSKEAFYVFSPDRFRDNPYPPYVVLTDLRIFDTSIQPGHDERLTTPISEATSITLRHDEHDLSIDYAGVHFSRPEANRYAYKLEPYESEWREVGTQRTVRYTNLDPGNYVFRVKAANVYGVWNEEGASLRITITPPWWQTTWAYLLYVVGLGFLVFAGYEGRVRRLKAHAVQLGEMVKERTRDLLAEKKKTEEQARRLVELDEAKNRFFANISHEFRTPLTLILGPLQDALDGVYKSDPTRLEKQFPVMHRNAHRLLRLINQLLDLSRLESGKLELNPALGDLVPFVQNLTGAFVPLAERRRVTLSFQSDLDTLLLAFDPDAMEKVVSNLISNALKFTPEGGNVLVTLKIAIMGASSFASVSVKDTGPGIEEEDLGYIFDRFQQADMSIRRKHGGSGVGLTLAKELIELHGGEIHVESKVGHGSLFTVGLPLTEVVPMLEESSDVALPSGNGMPEPAVQEATRLKTPHDDPQRPNPMSNGEKPTILVVEDNVDVRAYLRGHLEADYHVVEAEDGEVGLEAARAHRPDLVLSDVMMPRMDGYEMCRLLKANDALHSIPVVMLTAKAGEQDIIEGIGSGADDYLAKPFSAAELKARVAHLITTRREMREQYSREVVVRPADIIITPEEEVFLDQVLEVVNAHLGDSTFSVDWLAEEVGLSRRQLERKVESMTGEAPAELMRRLRLERASQLLRAHAGTVAEIAYAVGFNSASHFAKAFRKAYDVSPTEHIAQALEH